MIDNTATTLYPGGILNTGFALAWAEDRVHDAEPASATGGQPWALEKIQNGDQTCKANQALHGEAVNLVAKVARQPLLRPGGRRPAGADHVREQDQGARSTWPASSPTSRPAGTAPTSSRTSPAPRASGSRSPTASTPTRSTRPRSPLVRLPAAVRRPSGAEAPAVVQGRWRRCLFAARSWACTGSTLPPDPIQAQPSYAAALAAFEKLPPVRILFDNGAGSRRAGDPVPGFEQSFSRFPIPGTSARSWYLSAGGG